MAIFSGVKYALSSSTRSDDQRDLSNLLTANGAVEVPLAKATHVITPSFEFESKAVVPVDCHLVTPYWVERSQVLGKQQE